MSHASECEDSHRFGPRFLKGVPEASATPSAWSMRRLVERFADWDASARTKLIVVLAPLFVIFLVIVSLADNQGTSAVPTRTPHPTQRPSQTDVFLDSLDRKCAESRGVIERMVEISRKTIRDDFGVNVSAQDFLRAADAAVPPGSGSDCATLFAPLIVMLGLG